MSNEINNLYNRFKIDYLQDGWQAQQMENARRRYRRHTSNPDGDVNRSGTVLRKAIEVSFRELGD